tara:strand:+ start:660 stop:1052 length:393 start_codon:yes stop_codon:yes gene_type:complete
MPRTRKNVGLEHGGDYGTVEAISDSMDPNKGGIPLPAENVAPMQPAPTQPQRPAPPAVLGTQQPLPIDAAQAFTPKVTPLDAPGQTWGAKPAMVRSAPTPKQRSASLLQDWAAASGDPVLAEAAVQLSDG